MLYVILIFCIALIFPLGFIIIFSFFRAYMGYIGAMELGISSEFFKLFLRLLGILLASYIAPSIQKKYLKMCYEYPFAFTTQPVISLD